MRDNQGLTRLYAPISDNRAVSPRTSRSRPSRQRSPRPVSGYLRDNALRKQLDEKVKETARTRQAAEDGLRAAQDMLDQARRVDTNVAEAERALAEASAAMVAKDYKVAVDKSGEALERGRRSYRERARGIVDSSAALGRLAKGLGAALAETESTLAKAEGALAAEDLRGAIDHAKKAWKRSEKILQEHLSSSFSKAQALILSAKNMSRDVAPIEELLSRARSAMENNDFQSALDFTKEGLDTIREDMTAAMTREIRVAEDLVRTAAELGADTTKPANLIERARGDVTNLDFEKAKNALNQSRAESEKALQRSLDGRASDFSRILQEARAMGADPSAAQEVLTRAETAIKKGSYQEGAQLAKQGFQAVQQAQFQRVVAVLGTSREKFAVAANMGVDLKGPFEDLNTAREAIRRGAFQEAIEHAKRADVAVDAILERYRKAERRLAEHAAGLISTLRTSLPYLGDESGSLKALVNRADASMASQDFEGAFKAVAEGQELVEARVRTRAEEIVSDLALAVRIGVDLGANVTTLEALHRELNAYLGGGRVAEIVATRDKATAALAGIADNLVGLVRGRIGTAQGLKIDVEDMNDLVRPARMPFGVQNYHEGLRLLNDGNDRASKTSAMHRQAYNAIATAAAFVADAKKRNVDVSKVVEMLVDAKKAFEQLDLERAMQLAAAARTETDKLTVLYSSAQKILSSRSRLELAERLGIAAPHLRQVFADAKEAMKAKDYAKALAFAQRTEDEFTTLIKERLASSLMASEEVLSSLEGVDLAASSDTLVRARGHLEAGEVEQAAELALQLKTQLETLKRQGEETEAALRQIKDILADAEAMNAPLVRTQGLLERAERAYRLGQFDEALDIVAQADVEATKERDQTISAMMKRFEEGVMKARREGTDTRSPGKLRSE